MKNMRLSKFSNLLLPSFLLFVGLISIFFFTVQGMVIFDIDIARDFLILNEMVTTHHPILIGARTSVDGIFHGPFWLYVNTPVFILSGRNPVAVSWFWLILFLFGLGSIFTVGKKLFNNETALWAAALFTSQALFFIKSPTNPFAAVILFPIYFYLLILYLRKNHALHLFSIFLIAGLIIQSEMVFGLPVFILSLILILKQIFCTKKYIYILIIPAVLITTATFFLFDLKHNFLETHALIKFLSENKTAPFDITRIQYRLLGFTQGLRTFITAPHNTTDKMSQIANMFIFFTVMLVLLPIRKKLGPVKLPVDVFIFLYAGFWVMMLFTGSNVYWFYYWPFIGIASLLLAFCGFKKKIVYLLIIAGIIFNLLNSYNYLLSPGMKIYSWSQNLANAVSIYKEAPPRFGYYVNTLDQISNYIPMYTMLYTQQFFPAKQSIPFRKLPYTYIIVGPYPDGTPLDNTWWRKNVANIPKDPDKTRVYPNGYASEFYMLSEEEIKLPDGIMFNSLQYR